MKFLATAAALAGRSVPSRTLRRKPELAAEGVLATTTTVTVRPVITSQHYFFLFGFKTSRAFLEWMTRESKAGRLAVSTRGKDLLARTDDVIALLMGAPALAPSPASEVLSDDATATVDDVLAAVGVRAVRGANPAA